jgi:SET domain-containing protein
MNYELDNAPLTYVSHSNIHGYGLFAEIPFLKGDIVLNYGLFKDTWHEYLYSELPEEKKQKGNFVMVGPNRCIISDKVSKFAYVNHSKNPNCDYDLKNRLLVANRYISNGEEITIDYRLEYEPNGLDLPFWI